MWPCRTPLAGAPAQLHASPRQQPHHLLQLLDLIRQHATAAHQLHCLQGLAREQQPLEALRCDVGAPGQGQPHKGRECQVAKPSIRQRLQAAQSRGTAGQAADVRSTGWT
jgi:hypothetical protein